MRHKELQPLIQNHMWKEQGECVCLLENGEQHSVKLKAINHHHHHLSTVGKNPDPWTFW